MLLRSKLAMPQGVIISRRLTIGKCKIGSQVSDRCPLGYLFEFCQPPGAGAFSGDFTTNLARQCRAFSRALKIEKLKSRYSAAPRGAGLQMTGA